MVASVLALTLALASPQTPNASAATHDRDYWRAIIKSQYAVPAGASAFALAQELSGLLGSPDPELRDSIAISILSTWIADRPAVGFTNEQLYTLLDQWQKNLFVGLGETNTDTVLLRSFSALGLAALAERDRKTPFLGLARYRGLLDAAIAYLAAERDLRGFDPAKGWIHATAHTADLLRYLVGNPLFTNEEQPRLLAAIAERLSSARQVFTQGEQDRLAQVVAALATRKDFHAAGFNAWITGMRDTIRDSWRGGPLTSAGLATAQNGTYFLQALYARMSMETLVGPAATSRTAVLNALRPRQ